MFKLGSKFAAFVLVLLSFIYYISPLLQYEQNMASHPGDPYAHISAIYWFCENFFKYDFLNVKFFYPQGVDVSTGYDAPILNTLLCPLTVQRNMILTFNVYAVLQILLIFLTSFIVARSITNNIFLQICFLISYSFSSFYFARSTGHLNLLSTIWGVSLLYLIVWVWEINNFKKGIISGLLLALIFGSAWQNFPNLFLVVVVLMTAKFLKINWNTRFIYLKYLTISFLVALLLLVPVIIPPFTARVDVSRQIQDDASSIYNSDVLSYFIPWEKSVYAPYFQQIKNRIEKNGELPFFEKYNSIDPLYIMLFAFSILYLIKTRKISSVVPFLVLIIFSLLLSFGPIIRFAGKDILELDYYKVINNFPPLSMTRTPARMGIVVVFFVYILIYSSIEWFFASLRYSKYKEIFSISLLVYTVVITIPLSINFQFPHYNYANTLPWMGLKMISEDNSDVAVLNIPIAIARDPSQNFLQIFHKKPIISGYISYASQSEKVTNYIKNNPILNSLGCANDPFAFNQSLEEDIYINKSMISQAVFQKLIQQSKIKYLIINKQILKTDECKELSEYIEEQLSLFNFLEIIDENEYFRVLRVEYDDDRNRNYTFAFIDSIEGLSGPWGEEPYRWVVGTTSKINIYSGDDHTYCMTGKKLDINNEYRQKIFYTMNGKDFSSVSDDKFELKLKLKKGLNSLEIKTEKCFSPKELSINDDETCYSIGLSKLSLNRCD